MGRYFYQALLATPFVLLRNEEWTACADAFQQLRDKMEAEFNVKCVICQAKQNLSLKYLPPRKLQLLFWCNRYLSHLQTYYRALHSFCTGMSALYSFVDVTSGLEVVVHPHHNELIAATRDGLATRLLKQHSEEERLKKKNKEKTKTWDRWCLPQ